MGSFAKELTAADSSAVRAYLISRANALKTAATTSSATPPPGAAARQDTGHADN